MEEIWKNIDDLGSTYEVSNLGRIRNSKTKRIKSIVYDGHYCKFGYDCKINGERKGEGIEFIKQLQKHFYPIQKTNLLLII